MNKLKIGDKVIDIDDNYQPIGEFIVEEINDDGWIWGSKMSQPFYGVDMKKSFADPHFYHKIKNE